MVKVEVIEERLLQGARPVMRPEAEDNYDPSFAADSAVIKNSGWGQATGGWKSNSIVASEPKTVHQHHSDHGMVGKVWLGNPVTKEKKRVEPSLVAGMMAEGWVKAGPRTQL